MTATSFTRNAIEDQIRKYRSADKRDYAIRYANWLLTSALDGLEPDCGLPFMAKQAVRMDLRTIVRDDPFIGKELS